jgi:hypothetical protein
MIMNNKNQNHIQYKEDPNLYARPNRLINAMEEDDDIDIPLLNEDLNLSLVESLSMECVHNENEIRLAIENALNFVPTRIHICSSPILLNASEPNANGNQGILIYQKSLEFHCHVTDPNSAETTTTGNCILDAQSLSRMFMAFNSNLTFHGIDFINGNGNADSSYSSGGVFYVDLGSNIKLMDCGFMNNTAQFGGAMMVFNAIVVMTVHANQTMPKVAQYNVANRTGGFIYAEHATLEMYNINMKNNTATVGGAISTYNSALKLMGSDNPLLPNVVENNEANISGGFIYSQSATLEMYNINMKHNTATYGGAIYTFDSALKFIGTDNQALPTIVENNEADYSAGFINAVNSTLEMYNINMKHNTATYGGAIVTLDSALKLIGSGNLTLPTIVENNLATSLGGAVYAINTTLVVTQGYFLFRNNMAKNVRLIFRSFLHCHSVFGCVTFF